jgi:DNA-binding MarR family transcriptional regulator
VGREQHPTDRRARCVTLTRKGQQTYRKLSGELEPLQQRLLAALPSKDAETLVTFLGRIAEAMAPPNNRQARSKEPLKGERP